MTALSILDLVRVTEDTDARGALNNERALSSLSARPIDDWQCLDKLANKEWLIVFTLAELSLIRLLLHEGSAVAQRRCAYCVADLLGRLLSIRRIATWGNIRLHHPVAQLQSE